MLLIRATAFCATLLSGSALPALAAVDADGVCGPQEQALDLCFVTSNGFVVEVVPGPGGEFPVIDGSGNSEFTYLVTGPGAAGGSCQEVHDVSHADLLLPSCPDAPLDVVFSAPNGERLTDGQGDPSCGFGTGDLTHDVWKWDFGTSCQSSNLYTIVLEGVVPAEPTEFLLKMGGECETHTILGPGCPFPPPLIYCDSTPNSTGEPAGIQYDGTPSISANDFTLTVTDLPSDQPGIFFFGTEQAEVPFGNGVRCIGGSVTRFVKIPIVVNQAQVQLDFTQPPLTSIVPGTPYYFQFWYRDPLAGGAGFNTSDAICVTFAP